MTKEIATKLDFFAKEIAFRFSQKDRGRNFNKETFEIEEIIPMSEHTAVINFIKNTGKIAVVFCYYMPNIPSPTWRYFFPTDAHILGMMTFSYYKLEAERRNYKQNFKDGVQPISNGK